MNKFYALLLLGLLTVGLLPGPASASVRPLAPRHVQASITSNTSGGNWSAPGTWAGGVVPTSADDVTIRSGSTVTLDVAADINSLTINGSGRLITSGTTAYSLQVRGSLTNNGTLILSASTSLGSDLRFTGAGSVTFGGTGITDLFSLSLAKSTQTDVVDMNLPNLTVKTGTAASMGFLLTRNAANTTDDMTGTLKISGTTTLTARVFANGAGYFIPATGAFWLSNPNFTVGGQNGSPTVGGQLRISAGTFTVGTSSGNSILFQTGSVLTVDGGTLSSTGRIGNFTTAGSAPGAMTFALSSGTVNVCTVGNGAATPSFGITGSVTVSGGAINLVQRSTNATPLDYYVSKFATTNAFAITGGTLNLGTAATATNFDFRLRGSTPNLTVDNTTNAKTALLASTVFVYGNTLITPGATLNLNGFFLLAYGATITNNGTLTGSTAGSTLYFAGTGAQTYSGTGTASALRTLNVDNYSAAGVTLAAPLTAYRVNMYTGDLSGTSNLTIGDGSAVLFVVQFGVSGNTNTSGSFVSAPTFNIGSGSYLLIYAQETSSRTTGLEVPSSRVVDGVTISNPAGVTLAGGNLTINTRGVYAAGTLSLASGILTTSAANTAIIGAAATAWPTGSATSYVHGPLGIAVNSATATSRPFAVGDGAGWRPVVLSGIATTGAQTYTATVVSGATGSASPGLNPTRYVRLENTANLPASARVQLSYGADDVLSNAATAVVAQAASAAGRYYTRSGTTSTTPTTGIVSAQDLQPGFDFFVLADGTAPLPVELTEFAARTAAPADVALRWATAQEKNNAGFRVERSRDGQTFQAIGYLPGHGSSAQAHSYAFTDAGALTEARTLFYRLRQEDLNGQATYSPVRSVARPGAGPALTISPNPAQALTQLSGAAPGTLVRVVDALGRGVATATANAAGTAVLALPAGLPAGMYLVVAGAETRRLVVE